MMNVYTLFAMDEEPGTRVTGEFGHEIIGVFESYDEAVKEGLYYSDNHEALLITMTTLGGSNFNSKEVWKWNSSEW